MGHLPALADEPLSETAPCQQVQGAGVEVESPAETRPPPVAFDNDGANAGEPELAGE